MDQMEMLDMTRRYSKLTGLGNFRARVLLAVSIAERRL